MKQFVRTISDRISHHFRWQWLLMLGIVGLFGFLFYDAGAVFQAWSLQRVQTPSAVVFNRQPGVQASAAIAEAHLFGIDARSQSLAVPESTLQLTLTGILKSTGGQPSAAIIADNDATGQVYQEGSVLPGGAVLEAINDDHVVIKNEGRYEKLVLQRLSLFKEQ